MEDEGDFDNKFVDAEEGFYLSHAYSGMNGPEFTTGNDNTETNDSPTNIQTLESLRNFLDCYINGVKCQNDQSSQYDTHFKSEKGDQKSFCPPKPPRASASYEKERVLRSQLPAININLFLPQECLHCNKCKNLLHDIGAKRTHHEESQLKDKENAAHPCKKHADEMQHFEKKSFNRPNNLLKSMFGEKENVDWSERGRHITNTLTVIENEGNNLSDNVGDPVLTARGPFNSYLGTCKSETSISNRHKQTDTAAFSNANGRVDQTHLGNSSATSTSRASDSPIVGDREDVYSESIPQRKKRTLSDPDVPVTEEKTTTSLSSKHTFSRSLNSHWYSDNDFFSLPNYHSLNNQAPISSSINWQYPEKVSQDSDQHRIPTPLHDDLDVDSKELVSSTSKEFIGGSTTSTKGKQNSAGHASSEAKIPPTTQHRTETSKDDWFEHTANDPWVSNETTGASWNGSAFHDGSEDDKWKKPSTPELKRSAPYNKIDRVWSQPNTYNSHSYTIYSFAKDNGFEVHNVSADGNCMFRAVHDQLRINGIFHRTPKSIRMDAVSYLREHPNQDDGDHLKSFLGDEKSWEDYLERMSNVGEWGDHMMLKAIVDMLGRRLIVINVKPNDELRKTDLDPHDKTSPGYEEKPLYLGHIGESHYLSLRPVGWELEWPKVSLAERMKERRSEIRQLDMLAEEVETLRSSQNDPSEDNKYLEKTKNKIPASCDPLPSDMSLGNQIAETTDTPKDEGSKLEQRVMKEQISEAVLYIQTEDMDTWMKTDRAYIDSVSKQPMPHLSFLLENILQMSYFTTFLPYKPRGIVSEYIGSASDGSDRVLYNYSDCPEMSAYQQSLQKSPIPITFFPNNIKFPSCGQLERNDVCVVTENVHPGYCRLRPADKTLSCWKDIIYEDSNGICFIKDTKTSPLTDQSQGYRTTQASVQRGFKCLEWPTTATEWLTRKRPHKWPSEAHVKTMKENGYCILKGSHTSQSDIESQLEWRFVFSSAEKYLFEKCLSLAQLHGYCIFKSLVDYQLRLCDYKLKTIHIKSIFFFACEEISETMWQDSVGSCVMFMASKLLYFLQSKFIPNYFIKENNMVAPYDPQALADIHTRLEPIRIFPVETLMFMAERYGISQPTMMNKVMQDAKVYKTDNDLNRSIVHTFIPAKLDFARKLIHSFQFERANKCIRRAYEMHVTCPPSPDGTPPFVPERFTFFHNFLQSIHDIPDRITFSFFLLSQSPEYENIAGRDRGTREETKYIRDIIGQDTLLGLENEPIPAVCANNLFQEAKLLGGLAVYFHRLINYRESEVCLTWAIKHMKTVMKEEYIDVSEITDSDLKSTIGLRNVDNFRKWNSELYMCYKKLKILYTSMDNIEKMRYHMDDIEDLHERAPELSMTFFVEDLWNKLREPKRAKAVRARSAVPQLESSYDSINDVD